MTFTAEALVTDTVSTEELPAAMELGFAVIETVVVAAAFTVTVAVAVTFPVAPVAVAVYVVVAVGLTVWLPPVGDRV